VYLVRFDGPELGRDTREDLERAGAQVIAGSTGHWDHPFEGALHCGAVRVYYRERGTRQYVEASRIRARHLHCHRARHVAYRWGKHSRLSGSPAQSAVGFRCRYDRIGSDIGKTTCRDYPGVVRFLAYDSSPYH
jgi:hypothetical protein